MPIPNKPHIPKQSGGAKVVQGIIEIVRGNYIFAQVTGIG